MEQQTRHNKTQINKWDICQEINESEAQRKTRVEQKCGKEIKRLMEYTKILAYL